jgi:hypothetical protein
MDLLLLAKSLRAIRRLARELELERMRVRVMVRETERERRMALRVLRVLRRGYRRGAASSEHGRLARPGLCVEVRLWSQGR